MYFISLRKDSLLPSSTLKKFQSCSYHPIMWRLATHITNSNPQSGSSLNLPTRCKQEQTSATRPLYLVLVCSHLSAATAFKQNVARHHSWKIIPETYSPFFSPYAFSYCLPNCSFFKHFFPEERQYLRLVCNNVDLNQQEALGRQY